MLRSYGLLVLNETIASYSTTRLVSILIVDVLLPPMRYGAYSSSDLELSPDDDVKEKSNSSSSYVVSGSHGVFYGGDGVGMPSSLFSALRVSFMVIESA